MTHDVISGATGMCRKYDFFLQSLTIRDFFLQALTIGRSIFDNSRKKDLKISVDCQRLPDSRSRAHGSFSSFTSSPNSAIHKAVGRRAAGGCRSNCQLHSRLMGVSGIVPGKIMERPGTVRLAAL